MPRLLGNDACSRPEGKRGRDGCQTSLREVSRRRRGCRGGFASITSRMGCPRCQGLDPHLLRNALSSPVGFPLLLLFLVSFGLAGFFGMHFFQPAAPLEAWTSRTTLALMLAAMILSPVAMAIWISAAAGCSRAPFASFAPFRAGAASRAFRHPAPSPPFAHLRCVIRGLAAGQPSAIDRMDPRNRSHATTHTASILPHCPSFSPSRQLLRATPRASPNLLTPMAGAAASEANP